MTEAITAETEPRLSLWCNAQKHREWFDVFSAGLEGRTKGVLFEELIDWFFESGRELDGQKADRQNQSDLNAVDDTLTQLGRLFARWQLVNVDLDRSQRYTKNLRLPRDPDPRMGLTVRGKVLASRPEFWRDVEIFRLMLLTLAEQWFNKMRVPIALANFLFLIVKVSMSWNSITAQIVGIVGAGLMLLASVASASD